MEVDWLMWIEHDRCAWIGALPENPIGLVSKSFKQRWISRIDASLSESSPRHPASKSQDDGSTRSWMRSSS
jgi:hypothetical protein